MVINGQMRSPRLRRSQGLKKWNTHGILNIMKSICRLENPVMAYPWGSLTAIPDLLGTDPDPSQPKAEMWMGAHPKAPSTVICPDRRISLSALIQQHPADVLGVGVAAGEPQLPFLFKVLAAAQPLSIQAHPNKAQAAAGFRREEAAGIALDAARRNYRDANHKPECLCALTRFWALCGFRPYTEILALWRRVFSPLTDARLAGLQSSGVVGIDSFFKWLMTLSTESQQQLIHTALTGAHRRQAGDAVCRWMLTLGRAYPRDIGILAPLFLNLIVLEPGQALFLAPGQLHAYLEGVGVELMANSDNVLRGGLTGKHVDLDELIRVLSFDEKRVCVLSPEFIDSCEGFYDTPAEEFRLSVIHVGDRRTYRARRSRSVEILICTRGDAVIQSGERTASLRLSKGASVMVPAAAPAYTIQGHATFYKASVPTIGG